MIVLPGTNHLDQQMIHYHKCIRLLLQPQLYEGVVNERYLKLCTEACAGLCESYKRLHDRFPVSFSTISVQTVFLAGKILSRPYNSQTSFWLVLLGRPRHIGPWLTYRRLNASLLHMAGTINYGDQKHVRLVRLQHPTIHNDRTLAQYTAISWYIWSDQTPRTRSYGWRQASISKDLAWNDGRHLAQSTESWFWRKWRHRADVR